MNKELKKLEKKEYTSNEKIKFSSYINGEKVVIEAKDLEEANKLFAKIRESKDNKSIKE